MASSTNRGLGKGLGALLSQADQLSEDVQSAVVELKITDISPNSDQPRKFFDQQKLEELAASIRENGIIQPIIVCKGQSGYKIVAGERRWRASRLAGLKVIPAIIRELTELQVLQHALIENIQRQDLNPLEEAHALERLIREHNLTQEKLSTVVGRSRPAIANTLRLLNLSEPVRQMLISEAITAGHARALLAIPDPNDQKKLAEHVAEKSLSVRETEKLVKRWQKPRPQPVKQDDAYLLSIRQVEDRLKSSLGTKVKLRDRQGRGSIIIDYYSNDDLSRLLDRMGVEED